jgi:hypothetical protein
MQRLGIALRFGILALVMTGAGVGCADAEPTHDLSDDEVAAFCPPALEWFEIYQTGRQGSLRLGSRDRLEAEAEALDALDPVIQPGWHDKFDNDLRTELADVADDVDDRLASISAGGVGVTTEEIIGIDRSSKAASLNNFVIEVCDTR